MIPLYGSNFWARGVRLPLRAAADFDRPASNNAFISTCNLQPCTIVPLRVSGSSPGKRHHPIKTPTDLPTRTSASKMSHMWDISSGHKWDILNSHQQHIKHDRLNLVGKQIIASGWFKAVVSRSTVEVYIPRHTDLFIRHMLTSTGR